MLNPVKIVILCFVYLLVFLGLVTLTFSMGNLIVKNFVLRKGNGKLLDTLKDGVIVAGSKDGKLMFSNAAAKAFNQNLQESLCVELDATKPIKTNHGRETKPDDRSSFSIFDCKIKQFAKLDTQFT